MSPLRSLILINVLAASAVSQVTVTAPASIITVRAADDYATQILQDPWDMSQRTDIGWFTQGADQPFSGIVNQSFANGIFSGTTSNADSNFWLLDSGNPEAAPGVRDGDVYPIQSTKYKRLLMRMNLSAFTAAQLQLLWTNNSLYGGPINTANPVFVHPGWWVYSIDIPALGVGAGNTAWASAIVDSLRIDPVNVSNINVSLDWARLVEDDSALQRAITWTGAASVDIYFDNDNNWANGYVGQIANGASGGSFNFYVGGLPFGTYRVAIRPAGSSATPSYSSGSYQVGDIPRISFTAPSPLGSSDDFATVALGNPWDMDTVADVDEPQGLNGPPTIGNITAEIDSGTALGSVRVLQGTSAAVSGLVGDPRIYTLHFTKRGKNTNVDTSRYRILNLEMGVAGERDINAGSIARIVWRTLGEPFENVSDDIILNHDSDANIIQTLILDMKTLPIEAGAGSPSHTGWTGVLDAFRVDPHEFPDARPFWIKSVYLRAFERADASYTIRWDVDTQDTAAGPTMSLYWDTDGSGFNGTLVASGISPTAGSYVWTTSALPPGAYYLYTVVSQGGRVVNQNYARWPIVIAHGSAPPPTANIALSRTSLRFGATTGGTIVTGAQDVLVNVTGAGTVNWTAVANQPYVQIATPSVAGSGKFTVTVNGAALPPGSSTLNATITVTAAGAQNSPQTIQLTVSSMGTTAAPFGVVDTPINGTAGVVGASAVTGWALDDVEVARILIYRKPVGGETAPPNGLIYIGDGIFLAGARPDVQAAYPTMPLNDRAGWGLLVLTNMLPNGGNGTYQFVVHAQDREGKVTVLGSPAITANNAAAVKPFGTIDTPANGEIISGSAYLVFGWALTPQPGIIPTNASTIMVFVDGVPLGNPVYNQFRTDVAGLFPGYRNTQGPVGYFVLNTTLLTNGLHNIAWSVTDNLGRTEGIGSRFFNVLN